MPHFISASRAVQYYVPTTVASPEKNPSPHKPTDMSCSLLMVTFGKGGNPDLRLSVGLRGKSSERRSTQPNGQLGKQPFHQLFTWMGKTAEGTGKAQIGRLKFP